MASQQAFEDLFGRIRENDPDLTELNLRDSDISAWCRRKECRKFFANALGNNHTIIRVNLVHRCWAMLIEEHQIELMEAVCSLSKLEHLRYGSSGVAGLPLRVLNAGLAKTRGQLKSLSIQSIHFKDNFQFKTEQSSNTKDDEFVEFLRLLDKNGVLNDSIESFSIQHVEDTFDLDMLANALLTMPRLQEVVLQAHSPYNQRLTQQSVIRLFASKSIKSLALRRLRLGPILAEPLMMLENNNTLESLFLEQNGLDFECGMAIAYLLSINQTWKELNLGYNAIPDDCGSAIAAALSGNKSLISLDLAANFFELYTARRIAHLLARNESALQQLSLAQNPLRDEGVSMIAAGLDSNTTLKELSLAETKMTEASCSVIVASLYNNTALERLNLGGNKLRNEGCISLAVALESNATLTSLNISGNELRDASVLRLAEMLTVNATLERVNLGNNPDLTTTAYEALQRMLIDHNYSLHHLWLPTTVEIVMPNCKIPSFLKLNRLDRKRLLDELDNATLWMDVMQKASTLDLDSLFFLTRANPAVVSWMKT